LPRNSAAPCRRALHPDRGHRGGFLKHGGSDAQKSEWLGKIATGEAMLAFAFAEAQGRYNLADLKTTAKKQGNGYVLNGQKGGGRRAPWADTLIVTARTAGGQRDARASPVFSSTRRQKASQPAIIRLGRRPCLGGDLRERRGCGGR
jgi:alkylation response protein AidB-like acyl-CoA dehydrogenase